MPTRQIRVKYFAFIFVFVFSGIAYASVEPAAIFNDDMVLQRDKRVAVWGTASNGEEVTVEFAGQEKKVKADDSGKWKVFLDPLEADADGKEMRISSAKDTTARVIKNILVGEVWFCSGQSNMVFPMSKAKDFERDKADADLPLISYLTRNNKWYICTSKNLAKLSAVAYYFGKNIHKELNVPVGLVVRAVGGTPVEKWAPKDKILELDFAREAYEKVKDPKVEEQYNTYNKMNKEFRTAYGAWRKAKAEGKAAGERPKRGMKWRDNHLLAEISRFEILFYGGDRLGVLYRRMVKPVVPYTIRGFIWYQGEKDAKFYLTAYNYHKSLGVLIKSWREAWDDKGLPFFYVQLPNYKKNWPVIRESMAKVLVEVPNTGMAVSIDVGERDDIHPADKAPVGKRLALLALKNVYGKEIFAASPLYDKMSVDGDKAIISFKNVGGGLVLEKAAGSCFMVAGDDKEFHPATTRVEGGRVIVSSKNVQTPVAVRYAWEPDPKVTLYTRGGLPASPFRTDKWDVSF